MAGFRWCSCALDESSLSIGRVKRKLCLKVSMYILPLSLFLVLISAVLVVFQVKESRVQERGAQWRSPPSSPQSSSSWVPTCPAPCEQGDEHPICHDDDDDACDSNQERRRGNQRDRGGGRKRHGAVASIDAF